MRITANIPSHRTGGYAFATIHTNLDGIRVPVDTEGGALKALVLLLFITKTGNPRRVWNVYL